MPTKYFIINVPSTETYIGLNEGTLEIVCGTVKEVVDKYKEQKIVNPDLLPVPTNVKKSLAVGLEGLVYAHSPSS